MKIALLQATGELGHPDLNRGMLERAAHAARQQGAEVLVSPELFLPSYTPRAVCDQDGAGARREIARIADENDLWIVASTVEKSVENSFIVASLIDPHGQEVTRYRKRNLFGEDERRSFRPGTQLPEIVEINGWAVALGICFDVEFPEFVRDVALRGAELLLVPTAVPLRQPVDGAAHPLDTRIISELVVPTRAFESQLYIAYANQSGPVFSGHSTIADPYGRRLATAGDGEQLIIAELSKDVIADARAAVDYLAITRQRRTTY